MTKPKSKQPIIYSTNPDALRRADPSKLTEAQLAYREMLIRDDIAKLQRHGGSDAYSFELGDRMAAEAHKRMAPKTAPAEDTLDRDEAPKKKPAYANAQDIFSDGK